MKSRRDWADESLKGRGDPFTSDDELGLLWQRPRRSCSPRKRKYIESCDEEDDHEPKSAALEAGVIDLYLHIKIGLSSVQ